jgi:4-amino-4-deoxy-L-arabinose transferase-like glycosyltransferase
MVRGTQLAMLWWASPEAACDHFEHSQYVVGWQDKGLRVMADQHIYALAGWFYAHGASPLVANPEHPPLGKYLMGLSATWFGNFLTACRAGALLAILLIFSFARRVLGDPLSALVASGLFLNTQLFSDYTFQTYLDIFVLTFLAAGMWLLARLWAGEGSAAVQLLALAAVIGLGMAVKWSMIVLLVVSLLFFLLIRRYDWLITLVALMSLAGLLYAGTYAAFFADGRSLGEFAQLQAAIVQRWSVATAGAEQPPFTIWRILFTGYCNYGDYVTSNWRWYWPVVGAGAGVGLLYSFWKRAPLYWLCLLWFFGYMLFFSTGPTWDRYILPAFPAALIVMVGMVKDGARRLLYTNVRPEAQDANSR